MNFSKNAAQAVDFLDIGAHNVSMGMMKSKFKIAGTSSLGLLLLAGQSAMAISFRPTSEAPYVKEEISRPGGLSLGLSFNALFPLNNPYATSFTGTGVPFRYQAPWGMAVEVGYQLFDRWELLASFGYRKYEARADLGTNGGTPSFQTAALSSYPIFVVGRYRFGDSMGWSPEAEGGLGMSFNKLKVTATNVTAPGTEASFSGIEGFLAAGAAFAWLENYSLHVALGYAFAGWGSANYSSSVAQVSPSGVFSKASVRYQF